MRVPPVPASEKVSSSARVYCWSFFQFSSRRASTCDMKLSRSDCADGAAPPKAATRARAAKRRSIIKGNSGALAEY
jgi:hypothetical protein